jgi:hypothetical protein
MLQVRGNKLEQSASCCWLLLIQYRISVHLVADSGGWGAGAAALHVSAAAFLMTRSNAFER